MSTIYQFGKFRLDGEAGILFRGEEPTGLGQKAISLLRVLLETAGRPVSKDDLLKAAWPDLTVEESNLTVQIAALRRVIDEEYQHESCIENLPRRGYRYVGPEVEIAIQKTKATIQNAPVLTLPDRPSVAVLPFVNLSGDAEQEYFADGMVEDIIAGLSRIKWLFVVARYSSFIYKGRAEDVKRIGQELGVRYLLQGSIRRDRERVRISAQMIEAETGGHLWTERFDRPLDDIFTLQDEIALNVVGAIEPSLRRAEVERVKRKRPDNLDAYDLVLQTQADVFSGMPVQVKRALILLDHALSLEPQYALAHSYAAMCHHCLFLRDGFRDESKGASISHARSAIQYGQDDALALTFAGFSIGMDGHDHEAAFTALEAALTVSPSSALTYITGGIMLGWAGQAERAIEWGEKGLRLSPFDPWSWSAFHALTLGHFHLGRYERAASAAQKAIQYNQGHSVSHMLLAACLAKLNRLKEARTAAARVLELQPLFRYGRQFAGVDCAAALAVSLGEALRQAGLPE